MGTTMKGSAVAKCIEALGGVEVRKGKGSHVRFKCACGKNFTTVVVNKDIPIGTLKNIQKDLAACASFGEGWLGV